MKLFRTLAQSLVILCLLWPAITAAQSYAGGLHFMRSPDLVIERQDIALNLDRVSVEYVLNNTSNLDIIETLVFTLPVKSQFSVTVNNQATSYNIMQRAISYTGTDISNILKNLGLPHDPITAMHSIDASTNRDSIRNKLIAMNLLDPKDETPKWFVKIFYYWQQKFPAHAKIHIRQIYKPSILSKNIKIKGMSEIFNIPTKIVKKIFNVAVNWTFEDVQDDNNAAENLQSQLEKHNPQIKEFCPTIKDYLAIMSPNKKIDSNPSLVATKELNYDYYSQDIWATPINHFTLSIESPKNMHPMLCWNGDFKQRGESTLLFEADNYVPLQNISILFVEK